MTNKFVTARNTVSGVVGPVPASYLDHPVFSKQLVLVDEDAKDFAPELYMPKTADEFMTSRSKTSSRKGKDADAADEVAVETDNKDEENKSA